MRNMTISDFRAGRVPEKYGDDGCITDDWAAYEEYDYDTDMEQQWEARRDDEISGY